MGEKTSHTSTLNTMKVCRDDRLGWNEAPRNNTKTWKQNNLSITFNKSLKASELACLLQLRYILGLILSIRSQTSKKFWNVTKSTCIYPLREVSHLTGFLSHGTLGAANQPTNNHKWNRRTLMINHPRAFSQNLLPALWPLALSHFLESCTSSRGCEPLSPHNSPPGLFSPRGSPLWFSKKSYFSTTVDVDTSTHSSTMRTQQKPKNQPTINHFFPMTWSTTAQAKTLGVNRATQIVHPTCKRCNSPWTAQNKRNLQPWHLSRRTRSSRVDCGGSERWTLNIPCRGFDVREAVRGLVFWVVLVAVSLLESSWEIRLRGLRV